MNLSILKTSAVSLVYRFMALFLARFTLWVTILLSTTRIAAQPIEVVTELSPPNQLVINGQIGGSSTDIVRHVLSKANVDATINMYPWARAFHLAQKKPNTLLYSVAKTPDRLDKFQWLGKVAYFRLGFVTLASRSEINLRQVNDARPYRIAVQRGDISAKFFADRQFSTVQTADIKHSYRLLLSGKVDLVIDDPNYLGAMAKQFNVPTKELRFVRDIEQLSVYGYLAAHVDSDPQLVANIKAAFSAIEKAAWYQQKLYNPYQDVLTR
ncbi:substrate-binding periplasmic protein [Pseudoalteromonas ruthenica]|uniref:substrate-binding periplasmic protein n=1 Tax=Pseudoalteromonas ruthenica TaxID=151081 RepID=UPI001108BA32|nr:transporter substrate-binding domain-containing protein [Pseudoalteromonas ruthenica]